MKDLVIIKNKDGRQVVSARDIYTGLGLSSSNWAKWSRKNIENNQFATENEDFITLFQRKNGNDTKDYALSINFAKKICMLADTPKGNEIRDYFIEIEKQATKPQQLSTLDVLELTIKGMREQKIELDEVKQDIKELKAKSITRPDFFTVAGYASLNGMPVNLKLASSIGRKASKICKDRNIETDSMPDPRFGKVKLYPTYVLDEVFGMDLNNKKSA